MHLTYVKAGRVGLPSALCGTRILDGRRQVLPLVAVRLWFFTFFNFHAEG